MEILQYILCCIVILVLPPVTWVFGFIYWILKKFRYDNTDEELAELQQMIDNYKITKKKER